MDLNYGIESLDDETLKIMHKGLTKKMIIKGTEVNFNEYRK